MSPRTRVLVLNTPQNPTGKVRVRARVACPADMLAREEETESDALHRCLWHTT